MWRRYVALGVLVLWLGVALFRVTKLVEPAEQPPGAELTPAVLETVKADIPSDAGYLYVLPGEFGDDTGTGPRLRYELFPRKYDDVRASLDEASVRAIMRRENLRYVVVPDPGMYPADHWLRARRDWLTPKDQYVFEATAP